MRITLTDLRLAIDGTIIMSEVSRMNVENDRMFLQRSVPLQGFIASGENGNGNYIRREIGCSGVISLVRITLTDLRLAIDGTIIMSEVSRVIVESDRMLVHRNVPLQGFIASGENNNGNYIRREMGCRGSSAA